MAILPRKPARACCCTTCRTSLPDACCCLAAVKRVRPACATIRRFIRRLCSRSPHSVSPMPRRFSQKWSSRMHHRRKKIRAGRCARPSSVANTRCTASTVAGAAITRPKNCVYALSTSHKTTIAACRSTKPQRRRDRRLAKASTLRAHSATCRPTSARRSISPGRPSRWQNALKRSRPAC